MHVQQMIMMASLFNHNQIQVQQSRPRWRRSSITTRDTSIKLDDFVTLQPQSDTSASNSSDGVSLQWHQDTNVASIIDDATMQPSQQQLTITVKLLHHFRLSTLLRLLQRSRIVSGQLLSICLQLAVYVEKQLIVSNYYPST